MGAIQKSVIHFRLYYWGILLGILFGAVFCPALFAEPSTTQSLQDVSQWIGELQVRLKEKFGIKKIYVCGGSSLAIFDHIYKKKPLEFRDLDILVPLGKTVTREFADEVGIELESSMLGKYSQKDLRPRPRYNAQAKDPAAYNAGWGFFFNKPDGGILDLILFHSEEDIKLNGILDVDRILIPLEASDSLESWADKTKKLDPKKAYEAGLIRGDNYAYQNWVKKRAAISNDGEVKRDPFSATIRIIRAYAKMGVSQIPIGEIARLQKFLSNHQQQGEAEKPSSFTRFQFLRNTLKLLDDPNWNTELKMLAETGALEVLNLSLSRKIAQTSVTEFKKIVAAGKTSEKQSTEEKFLALVSELPPRETASLIKPLFQIDPKLAFKFLTQIALKSERGPPLRIGYFTGEFAPFHEGHLNVAKTAIEKGHVDFVFVIPTPHPTNLPKTERFSPKDWTERIRFSELGTDTEDRIFVYPNEHIIDLKKRTSLKDIRDSLESTLGIPGEAVHIAGGDSLLRILERGFLDKDPRKRVIVERMGATLPDTKMLQKHQVAVEPGLDVPISATLSLHDIAAGIIPRFLKPAVYIFLLGLDRYQEIIEDLKWERKRIERLGEKVPTKKKGKTYIFHTEKLLGDYFHGLAEPPVAELKALFEEMARHQPKEILVYVDKDAFTEIHNAWIKFCKKMSIPNMRVVNDYSDVPYDKRIRVIHAGNANYWFQHEMLAERMKKGQGFLLYETPDYPASYLLHDLPGVDIFPIGDNTKRLKRKCTSVTGALGGN